MTGKRNGRFKAERGGAVVETVGRWSERGDMGAGNGRTGKGVREGGED